MSHGPVAGDEPMDEGGTLYGSAEAAAAAGEGATRGGRDSAAAGGPARGPERANRPSAESRAADRNWGDAIEEFALRRREVDDRPAPPRARDIAPDKRVDGRTMERTEVLAEVVADLVQRVEELRSAEEELRSLNAELESRVAEQTAELAASRRLSEELLQREQTARASAELAQERVAFLATVSSALSASLDYGSTVASIARLAVPTLADWCVLCVTDDRGGADLQQFEAIAADEQIRGAVREVRQQVGGGAHVWKLVERARKEARTELLPSLADRSDQLAPVAEELASLESAGFRSLMAVPLLARGRDLGALMLVVAGGRAPLDRAAQALAEDFARRAAVALDNAGLHRAMAKARSEAEAANQIKSDFLAVVSHELRTPLNAICGYAELLELGIHGAVNDLQREDLRRIQRNQADLLGLINAILDFTKLEAGYTPPDMGSVAVHDLLSWLEGMIAPQLRAHSLRFEYRGGPAEITVRADREKLRQILLNLLSNAVKFTPPGGTIEVGFDADDDQVHMRVRDSGRGIPADQRESIFEPFVRVERGLTRATGGAGLGLSISRRLARAMGGDLFVESELGSGSTFTITLRRGDLPSLVTLHQGEEPA